MQIGRRVLYAAQWKRLDGSIGGHHRAMVHPRGEETPGLQIVRRVVGVIGRNMARRALRFAEKQLLPSELGFGGLLWIEFAKNVQLRRRWKVEQLLDLRHRLHLAAAVKNVDALLGGDDRVAIEVGGALLEFREVLDALQRPLRAE